MASHDHACLLFASTEEQARALAAFMQDAFARNERVVYILDQDADTGVLERLHRHGIDVSEQLERGALQVRSTDEVYLADGAFDPAAMLDRLREVERDAIADGWRGVRVAGEMTWATRGAPGSDRLLEYESKLNEVFPKLHASALCQYDARAFSPDILAGALRTHPLVVSHGEAVDNPYFEAAR